MEYFDESDSPRGRSPRRRLPRRGADPEQQRQILLRRAIAAGAGLLVVILLVLGVRGCLDARQERAYENFASQLDTLVGETDQLANQFFSRLADPGDRSAVDFPNEIGADRGTAEGLLTRVRNLSAPSDLDGARAELEIAYMLRRDALAAFTEIIPTALGEEGQREAIEELAREIETLLASDAIYRRARRDINQVLEREGIDAQAPRSRFVDEPLRWLDPLELTQALGTVSGGGEEVDGVRGLGLSQTVLSPGEIALSPDATTTASAGETPEIEVTVQNQGEVEEEDVIITVRGSGAISFEGDGRIASLGPGETGTATIAIQPAPSSGQTISLEVLVEPVPGEQILENNRATYEISFE